MKYSLDTNAVIGLLKKEARLTTRLRRHKSSDFAISAIVAHELYFGVAKSQRQPSNLVRVDSLAFEILQFDREDARHAAYLRASLASAGTPIGPYDLLIAGQALARDLIVVTRNTREFSRVPGLTIENWEV